MGFKPLTYKNAPGEEPHITPEDDAAIYESIVGTDGVFTVGEQFKATVISNNKVRIGNGVLNVGGHMGRTTYGDYVDVTIENGVSEQNRNDLIIARFVIGDTDTYELDVKKGVSGKEAVDPELVQEDLYNGGKTREYPLYRVKIEGLSIVKVEQMFEVRPTISMLNRYLSDSCIGFPDYTKVLGEYSNKTFTAPENCWARIMSTSGWTNTTLNVNGNGVIIQQIQNTDSYPIRTTSMIPLKKGDVVTMSSQTKINGITVVLYPMRK